MTLPEVLIALLVFASIAAASVYALRLGVDSRDQLDAADTKLKSFQIARTLIKDDLAQITGRVVRDEFGAPLPAAFLGNMVSFGGRAADDERVLAAFVRNGWLNPGAGDPRSSLQRVEYVFRNGALIRRAYVYLDETASSEKTERVLFDGLADARAAYLIGEQRGELSWADIWPATGSVSPPRALSLTLEWEDAPPLRQLFWIGRIAGRSSRS